MKKLFIDCACGHVCTTQLIVNADKEKPGNVILTFHGEKFPLGAFVSLNKEGALELMRFLKKTYKEGANG